MTTPNIVYEARVAQEWVDYNGHMRDAYYGLVFSYAIDALMIDLGMDEAYRTQVKGTLYVVEMHQFFLKEAHEGGALKVAARLLDADTKRLHVYFEMLDGDTGERLAAQESLQLHVIQNDEPKSGPFTAEVQDAVDARVAASAQLPTPDLHSGVIAVKRRLR
jgi:acyl-CoA thioester hydrolase